MKRKILSLIALVLSAALLLLAAACAAVGANGGTPPGVSSSGGENAPSNPVNITFYTYNYMNQQKDGVDKLIADFSAENPDVNVEIVFLQSNELNTKIQADLAAGVTPDVIQVTFDALDYAVNNFGIRDLNDIAPKDELERHLAGFSPAALNVAKVDGHLYGLPYTFSTPMLFYNTAIFAEAGLDPDDPPKTWEEVEAAALQIKEKTGKEGFVFGGTSVNDWLLQGVIRSNGGGVLSEDRENIIFGEPAAVEAVQMLQDMRKSGAHADMNDYQAYSEAFPAGNLGMMLATAAIQASILKAAEAGGWEVRTAKMPSFGGKPAVPVNSGSGLFICSDDKQKQAAAWRFIEYVTSDDGYTTITTMMGYPPLRPGAIKDERFLKNWAEENPLVLPNLEQIEYVTPWQAYPGDNWLQIETILMDALNTCLFTDADVEATMKAAQTQAQSLMP
jgi:multiple sugar transport system substrate-binding protein